MTAPHLPPPHPLTAPAAAPSTAAGHGYLPPTAAITGPVREPTVTPVGGDQPGPTHPRRGKSS